MKKGITTMKNIEKIIKVQLCKEMIEELNLTESTVFETRVKDGFLVLQVVDKENSHFDEDSYEEGFYEGVDEGEIDGYKLGYAIGYEDGNARNAFDDSFPLVEEDDMPCCCKCCVCDKCCKCRN
jgi:hypothetical protein